MLGEGCIMSKTKIHCSISLLLHTRNGVSIADPYQPKGRSDVPHIELYLSVQILLLNGFFFHLKNLFHLFENSA